MSSLQAPINSGFGPLSTALEILDNADLTGKTAIVTGGYSGIGLETTRALVQAGATVIVPARNPDKAQEALAVIPRIKQVQMDLLDPASINAFADAFLVSGRPLDRKRRGGDGGESELTRWPLSFAATRPMRPRTGFLVASSSKAAVCQAREPWCGRRRRARVHP